MQSQKFGYSYFQFSKFYTKSIPFAPKKYYIQGMSKLIARILVGVIVAAVLMAINEFLVPESLYMNDAFNHFMSVCYFACIIVPCVIYFIKTPPGTNNKGERVG